MHAWIAFVPFITVLSKSDESFGHTCMDSSMHAWMHGLKGFHHYVQNAYLFRRLQNLEIPLLLMSFYFFR